MMDLGIQSSILAFLALFFAGSGFHKVFHFKEFEQTISGYGLLSGSLISLVAGVLTVLEISITVLIVSGISIFLASLLSIGLLGLYGLMMTVVLVQGKTGIDCGCSWGNSKHITPITTALIYRNTLLFLVAAISLLQPAARDLLWLDYVTISMVAISGIFIYQTYESYVSVVEFQKEYHQ